GHRIRLSLGRERVVASMHAHEAAPHIAKLAGQRKPDPEVLVFADLQLLVEPAGGKNPVAPGKNGRRRDEVKGEKRLPRFGPRSDRVTAIDVSEIDAFRRDE